MSTEKIVRALHKGRERPDECEVCGREGRRICLDHDHGTGRFRGWLCNQCNFAIGLADDNPDLLRRLANYLENNLGWRDRVERRNRRQGNAREDVQALSQWLDDPDEGGSVYSSRCRV